MFNFTRMRRSRKGERMSAVKVLETTVGGFFSGSLNKCWTQKESLKWRLLGCVSAGIKTPTFDGYIGRELAL